MSCIKCIHKWLKDAMDRGQAIHYVGAIPCNDCSRNISPVDNFEPIPDQQDYFDKKE